MRVIRVTNLNDSGTGSLRDALSQGNRRIKFLVGGTILVITALLLGCASGPFATKPIPTQQTLLPAAKKAQNAINEANVTLTAAANVLATKKKEGIVTRAQAQRDLDKIKKYGEDLDKLQDLLDAGSALSAENKAKALNVSILALRKEIAARKAKP